MCILDVMCPQESQVFVVYRPIFLPKISKISSAKRSFRSIRVANSHLPMSRASPCFTAREPVSFPAFVVILLFSSPSSPFVTRKPRLCDFHRFLHQFRFPLFKVARYLVLDPLSPLYICFVRSLFDRQRGDDRFFSTLSTSTRFDRTRFVRLSIPGSCMAIVVTELVVDIFARILFVSAKGTCNIPVSFVENRYKLDVNR